MDMQSKKLLLPVTAILLSLLVTACGGGGGGGGGNSNGSQSITYSGSTQPANLDSGNAQEVSGSATEMGTFGGSASLVASANPETSTEVTGSSILTRTAIKAITNKLNADITAVGAISTFNDSIAGSCGGTSSINMTVDDTAYTFSGTLSFNNLCEGDITLSGTANISGSLSGSTITFTMNIANLVVSDKSTGYVYKAENYITTITTDTSVTYMTVTISGKFYHPVYGYVLVSTLSPLEYSGSNIWPNAGAIKVKEDGAAPIDSATLTALNSTQYQLDIDLGSDDVVDSSTTGNWADL